MRCRRDYLSLLKVLNDPCTKLEDNNEPVKISGIFDEFKYTPDGITYFNDVL